MKLLLRLSDFGMAFGDGLVLSADFSLCVFCLHLNLMLECLSVASKTTLVLRSKCLIVLKVGHQGKISVFEVSLFSFAVMLVMV